jgi:hypothetical protein
VAEKTASRRPTPLEPFVPGRRLHFQKLPPKPHLKARVKAAKVPAKVQAMVKKRWTLLNGPKAQNA